MAIQRFKAIEIAQNRAKVLVDTPSSKVSEYFGSNVYNEKKMRATLSHETFKQLKEAISKDNSIQKELADEVATGMKTWAIAEGATHYTHWFQPLTGATAEKHDAFMSVVGDGEVIERFKGSELAQQEPDASSFPNGGLRTTFEARGYTAWDPNSPAFIMDLNGNKTLCIPTIFVSYTGEALDYKMPLLKALDLVNKAATKVCNLFDKEVKSVKATLGVEQEYFLVDRALYYARPDLVLTGKTVFGHQPAKGQQLDDHYFGSIPTRARAFIADFEQECYKLGIPITTRHNEVAPGQFECAPFFEEVNLAVDHNLLLMDIMRKVSTRHNLEVLFHEKPFAGLNGSGKHNNWSLQTDTGINLLSPSTRAKENLQFLTFFVNTIKAVHTHAKVLRASIASAGNAYRLGANEAPPAIISVFIGSELSKVLDELEENAEVAIEKGDNLYMKLGIDKIPPVLMDNTDRNRTSPFAFTGNKFEFRAVGSNANCSASMIVLNTIVADQLMTFSEEVEKEIKENKAIKKELAIINVLRRYIKDAKSVIFEGDGYSGDWVKEAKKRGLPNITSTPKSFEAFVEKDTIEMFAKHDVLKPSESEARYELLLEKYLLEVQIESRTIGDLALNHVIPTAIRYQNVLLDNVRGLMKIDEKSVSLDTIKKMINEISEHVNEVYEGVDKMTEARKKANKKAVKDRALDYDQKVKPFFDKIRYHVDKLELIVDDEMWTLAKYREILMVR